MPVSNPCLGLVLAPAVSPASWGVGLASVRHGRRPCRRLQGGIEKARDLTCWEPRINVRDGVGQLIGWLRDNALLFDWLK